jgi:hypothetical protein
MSKPAEVGAKACVVYRVVFWDHDLGHSDVSIAKGVVM